MFIGFLIYLRKLILEHISLKTLDLFIEIKMNSNKRNIYCKNTNISNY